MTRRLRNNLLVMLILMALTEHRAGGQTPRPEPLSQSDAISERLQRDVLQPAPKEVLRRGLMPLSARLPDTGVSEGILPPDSSQGLFEEVEARRTTFRSGEFTHTQFPWVASELRYKPLYFEDAMLERHGQTRSPLIQPLASGTRFFLTFPVLPYAMVVDRPGIARSALGHYRPGTPTPLLLQRPPLQANAGIAEAGVWIGLIFLIP